MFLPCRMAYPVICKTDEGSCAFLPQDKPHGKRYNGTSDNRKVEIPHVFMNTFKKIAIRFGAPILAIALPLFASAQIQPPPVSAPSNYTNINQIAGQSGILCVVINWIFYLLIILTIIFVLYAAFKYLTAGGDPEKVKAAGSILLYAVIAIVVALLAKGIPLIVSSFIGGGLSGVGC